MLVYIILCVFFLLFPVLFKNKKLFCFIGFILLVLIVGLRNYELGKNDTLNVYIPYFKTISNFDSITDVITFVRIRDTEFLFYFISFLFAKCSTGITNYLLFLSIPFYASASYLICNHSKYPSLSFIMLLSLNYFGMSFYMLRHTVALGFVIIALMYYLKNNYKRSVFFALLGSLFHRSALIVMIIYLIRKINLKKQNYIFISILSYIVAVYFSPIILNLMSFIFKSGHFSYYINNIVASSHTLFFINFLILIVLCLFYKHSKEGDEKKYGNYLKLQTLACIFSSFTMVLSEFMRISTFFSIISIVSIPYVISTISNPKIRIAINIIFYMVFIIYFFMFSAVNNNIMPYSFFKEV